MIDWSRFNPTPAQLVVIAIFLALGAGAVVAAVRWRHHQEHVRAEHARALAAQLAPARQSHWIQIERDEGFSRMDTRRYPQVAMPADVREPRWLEIRVRPDRPQAALERGVILRWNPDRGLHLSPAQADLPDHLRAERPEQASWLLLTYSQILGDAYAFDNGRVAAVERLDARLVTGFGEHLARATVEAVPPAEERYVRERYQLPEEFEAELAERMVTSASVSPIVERPPPQERPSCIVDDVPTQWSDSESNGPCVAGILEICLERCEGGDGRSCAVAAYLAERDDNAHARPLYARGCQLGDINACTNWAAGIHSDFHDDRELVSCARRLFERTCEGGDHHGCGMYASTLVHGDGLEAPERDTARSLLESSCATLGGFSCDMLARLIDEGALIEQRDGEAEDARRRACETGYQPACAH